MQVELAKSGGDLAVILEMARRHPEPEYDCTFEHYADVLKALWKKPWIRMWIARDGARPAGYLIAAMDMSTLVSQVNVVDIYLEEEYRGTGLVVDLLNELGDWAFKALKVKRVRWTSRWPRWGWAKVCDRMRYKLRVDEYKIFTATEEGV